MKYLTIIWCAMVLILACAGDAEKKQQLPDEPMDSFPKAEFQRLLKECDNVDIIFYDSPISMSQDDRASIRGALFFIDPIRIAPLGDCKPLGRISYMINGAIAAEADFYCEGECTYFVFMENGKPAYANAMSQNGIEFFQSILVQINNQTLTQ